MRERKTITKEANETTRETTYHESLRRIQIVATLVVRALAQEANKLVLPLARGDMTAEDNKKERAALDVLMRYLRRAMREDLGTQDSNDEMKEA